MRIAFDLSAPAIHWHFHIRTLMEQMVAIEDNMGACMHAEDAEYASLLNQVHPEPLLFVLVGMFRKLITINHDIVGHMTSRHNFQAVFTVHHLHSLLIKVTLYLVHIKLLIHNITYHIITLEVLHPDAVLGTSLSVS